MPKRRKSLRSQQGLPHTKKYVPIEERPCKFCNGPKLLMAFKGMDGCSEACRKVLDGEMTPEEWNDLRSDVANTVQQKYLPRPLEGSVREERVIHQQPNTSEPWLRSTKGVEQPLTKKLRKQNKRRELEKFIEDQQLGFGDGDNNSTVLP